jgi:hypothetical protein
MAKGTHSCTVYPRAQRPCTLGEAVLLFEPRKPFFGSDVCPLDAVLEISERERHARVALPARAAKELEPRPLTAE